MVVDNILSIYREYDTILDNILSKGFTTDIKEIKILLDELNTKIRKVKKDDSENNANNNN